MSFATDIQFSGNFKVLDNLLSFDYALNIPKGAFFARDNFDETANADGKEYHPNYSKLVKGTHNLFLMKGSVKQFFQFDDEPDMEVFQQFSEYSLEENTIPYHLNLDGTTIECTYSIDYSLDTWQTPPMMYVPKMDKSHIEMQSEDNTCICVLRLDEEPEAWIPEIIDIQNGNSLTIEKQGNKCYIVFGGSVNSLEPYKMYELTSDTLEVTANEDLRAFRIYRD